MSPFSLFRHAPTPCFVLVHQHLRAAGRGPPGLWSTCTCGPPAWATCWAPPATPRHWQPRGRPSCSSPTRHCGQTHPPPWPGCCSLWVRVGGGLEHCLRGKPPATQHPAVAHTLCLGCMKHAFHPLVGPVCDGALTNASARGDVGETLWGNNVCAQPSVPCSDRCLTRCASPAQLAVTGRSLHARL